MKAVILFFVFLVSLSILTTVAKAEQTAWKWENYEGITFWRVEVIEDETGCGGGIETMFYPLAIQHNLKTADVGDWGHGKTKGTFEGNTLSIPGRTIRDGAGQSRLSYVKVSFTPECASFYGKYTWDYADSQMSCSGSTILKGTRENFHGCPELREKETEATEVQASDEKMRTDLRKARSETEEKNKENQYKEILAKDPKNFWANWDMAELKRKQGNAQEFFNYFNKATSNENIFQETREKLKKYEAERLHLSEFPTPGKSPILRFATDDVNSWQGGVINNLNIPKEEAADKKTWGTKIKALLDPDWGKKVYEIAGIQ